MILIIMLKPKILYNHKTNTFKKFGSSKDETIFNIYSVSVVLAIIIYLFFNNIKKKKSDPLIDNSDILKQILSQKILSKIID